MSTMLQRFGANQARRSLESTQVAACPGACHQPAGNGARQDAMDSPTTDTSWLDGFDVDGAAYASHDTRLLHGSLDTGYLQDGGFGSKAEVALGSGRTALYGNGCALEGAAGKLAYESSTKAGGASATALEVAVDCRGPDADVADVFQVRAGLGQGVGGALRSSVTDVDGDGRPECNYGIDLGPLSADTTSEVFCPTALVSPWWAE